MEVDEDDDNQATCRAEACKTIPCLPWPEGQPSVLFVGKEPEEFNLTADWSRPRVDEDHEHLNIAVSLARVPKEEDVEIDQADAEAANINSDALGGWSPPLEHHLQPLASNLFREEGMGARENWGERARDAGNEGSNMRGRSEDGGRGTDFALTLGAGSGMRRRATTHTEFPRGVEARGMGEERVEGEGIRVNARRGGGSEGKGTGRNGRQGKAEGEVGMAHPQLALVGHSCLKVEGGGSHVLVWNGTDGECKECEEKVTVLLNEGANAPERGFSVTAVDVDHTSFPLPSENGISGRMRPGLLRRGKGRGEELKDPAQDLSGALQAGAQERGSGS
ncbi:unnamed protein product [Discosporangium mesarthrocarpum]